MPISLTGCLKQNFITNTLSGDCGDNLIVKRITNLESVPKKTEVTNACAGLIRIRKGSFEYFRAAIA